MTTALIIVSVILAFALVTIVICIVRMVKTERDEVSLNTSYYAMREKLDLIEPRMQQLEQESISMQIEATTLRTQERQYTTKIDELQATINSLNGQIDQYAEKERQSISRIKTLEMELKQANEQQQQLMQRQAELTRQSQETFRNIANEILKQNTADLRASSETRIGEILKPFKENIEAMQSQIRNYYENGLKETSSLKTTIDELTRLNNQLGKEANELTTALRGNVNNTQGPWGEMILKQILEGSGLIEGINFKMQATTNLDGSPIDGNYRPDALLFFPDHKVLVVDSKVNITAYIQYANAQDEESRKSLLAEHLRAVEAQINTLSNKAYQNAVKDSAEFVVMFMPNEGSFMAAMHADNNLWQKAYNKQVLIVSPTHLVSVVKMMSQLWNNDKQNRNAITIAQETGKLLDKLANFVDDLNKVGKAIDNAQNSFTDAMKKLKTGKGNILGRAEKIKELGAKAAKQLPQDYEHDDEYNTERTLSAERQDNSSLTEETE
ncbi:MAG: DNA recombination protein RmuC [Muribaculaceae bacterium]